MNFFEWIKKSNENLKQVEDKIYKSRSDVIEIYHRNMALEKEIAQRTEELHKANQTLLTLEHVWDMMNSSRPLSSVLETIVESLHGEFGYLYSCIIQKQTDSQGEFFVFRTFLQNEFVERINSILEMSFAETRMNYKRFGIIDEIIASGKIASCSQIDKIINEIYPDISPEHAQKMKATATSKSVIILPLFSSKEFFGCLAVFSPRPSPNENELNFLNLFGRQIELAITIANLFETVKKQAVTDPLTELFNRRFYEDAISREASRALRLNQPFSLISLDLDHLKQINDNHGHSAGDKAIVAIAKAISENARSVDIASRIGGEEFSIILPGIDAAGGMIAAERLRQSIENSVVDEVGKITASIGVATFIEHTVNLDELIEIADRAMYLAKKSGRNQVKLATTQKEVSWQEVAIETFIEILEKHRIPFDTKTAKILSKKLQSKEAQNQGNSTKEILFSVVDSIYRAYTPYHTKGITQDKVNLASLLAKKFDLPKAEIDKLKIAMLLYDIGNAMLPNEILKKAGELTKEEKEKITKHPIIAAQEILKPISKISDIIPIIEHHHENWDGTGYPNNIRGEQIPLISQIILVTDSFYAMLSDRPYRNALTEIEAVEEIKKSAGEKYSEEIVEQFIRVLQENNILILEQQT